MAEADRKAQAPSLRPSLSLPVVDSTRSAREGSFPSFSRKLCMRFLLIKRTAFLFTEVDRCQQEQPHRASETLPASLPESTHSQLGWHPLVGLTPCQAEISTRSLDSKIQIACPWCSYFLFSYQYQMHGPQLET